MPFTFSHPALVLPLINRHWKIFSVTGLIIGSIIPDFESFIRFDEHKLYSHTWLGVFWFDLPLAILAAFLFHNIVRDPLIKNLPGSLGDKFAKAVGFNWNVFFFRHFFIVITSLLIGITSHLLWDAFTHLNLSQPDINSTKMLIFNTYLHSLLQEISSVAGLIIMVWYIIRMPDQSIHGRVAAGGVAANSKIQFWLLVMAVNVLVVLLVRSFIPNLHRIILNIDIVISGFLLGLVATGIFYSFRKQSPEPTNS
jgi:uncharacterized protein DUF4184